MLTGLKVSSLACKRVFYPPELMQRGIPIAQKMKFCIKCFFSKCDQIRSKLQIWSHILKKSLMKNFIFCAVPDGT